MNAWPCILVQNAFFTDSNAVSAWQAAFSTAGGTAGGNAAETPTCALTFVSCTFTQQGATHLIEYMQHQPDVVPYRLVFRHCSGVSWLLHALGGAASRLESLRKALRKLEVYMPRTTLGTTRDGLLWPNHFPNLDTLVLGGCNCLGRSSLSALANTLQRNTHCIERLSLWSCSLQLSFNVLTNIAKALSACPQLHTLDLSHNLALLTPAGPMHRFMAAVQRTTALNALPVILSALPLRSLNLSSIRISSQNSRFVWDVLQHMSSLSQLFMVGCGLDNSSCSHLVRLLQLRRLPCLAHLNVSDNPFRAAAPDLVAAAARAPLQRLMMHQCGMQPQTGAALQHLLHTCPSLRVLCVKNNQLGCEGVSAIARGLRAARSLRTLDLASNGVGDAGGKALARALIDPQCPQSLQHVKLVGNLPSIWAALADMSTAVLVRSARGRDEAAAMHRLLAWVAAPFRPWRPVGAVAGGGGPPCPLPRRLPPLPQRTSASQCPAVWCLRWQGTPAS